MSLTLLYAAVGFAGDAKPGKKPGGNLADLRRANISALADKNDRQSLRKAIEEIERIQLARKSLKKSKPAATQPAKPKKATTQPSAKEIAKAGAIALKAINKQTLDRFKKNIKNPLALADALFDRSMTESAAEFYAQALERKGTDHDQAWAMFQLANCRRAGKPKAALEMYRQMLDAHPRCQWANTAETQIRLIEWHELNKPKATLKQATEMTVTQAPSKAR